MAKIESMDDLRKMAEAYRAKILLREKGENFENLVRVNIGMGTVGIASGAKEVFFYFIEALEKNNIEAVVTQTADMGYSVPEPVVEITLPTKGPVIFGNVTNIKIEQIIDSYIKKGDKMDGLSPEDIHTTDNK